MSDDTERRLTAMLNSGTASDLRAWAETGRPGLVLLRAYLDGAWRPAPSRDIHSRDVVDNTSAAIAAIAEAHPVDFLDVFPEGPLGDVSWVLTGLGRIDDPRATDRLARAARSLDQWRRMDAAIGLGRRPSTVATAALAVLVRDAEYLVRYHAFHSLERIGDASVLPVLRDLDPRSPIESELAARTIDAIAARSSADPASG